MRRRVLASALVLLWVGASGVEGKDDASAAPAPWVRTRTEEGRLVLEVASRELLPPDGKGPRLWLVGAIHVADAPFYERVQRLLDAQSLTLYERVLPPGAGRLRSDPPEAAVEDTRARLRFLGGLVGTVEEKTNEVPEDLAALASAAAARSVQLGDLARRTRRDAWGREILLVRGRPSDPGLGWRVVSLGADGIAGGEGPAADLVLGSEDRVRPLGAGGGFDLQRELASVLRLTYQGDGIDYDRRRWVHSDFAMDELERAAKARGGDLQRVLEMLEGDGLRGALLRLLIGTVKLADDLTRGRASAYVKVLLSVTLAESDPERSSSSEAVDVATMKAILLDRNARVLEDLARTVAEQPRLFTIGVFYGAAHMPDLLRNLRDGGWTVGREIWIPAITVDLDEAGVGAVELEEMRERARSR